MQLEYGFPTVTLDKRMMNIHMLELLRGLLTDCDEEKNEKNKEKVYMDWHFRCQSEKLKTIPQVNETTLRTL